jgi:hypothetical protein
MRLRRGSGEGEGDLFGSTFGEWVDRALLSDAAMICLGLLLFPAAHVAALVVALKAKRPSGIFVVNAAFSLLVLFYLLSQPEYFFDIFEGGKDPFWLPAAIEFAALGCAVAVLCILRAERDRSRLFRFPRHRRRRVPLKDADARFAPLPPQSSTAAWSGLAAGAALVERISASSGNALSETKVISRKSLE